MTRLQIRDEINAVRNLATAVRIMSDGAGGGREMSAFAQVAAAIEDRLEALGDAVAKEAGR